jgi:VWFA-related protein
MAAPLCLFGRSGRWPGLTLACVSLAAAATSGGGSLFAIPPDDQAPAFRSGVRTVAVYATVRARDGRLVPDLTRDDFQILDNGVPVALTTFSNEGLPFTAALLLDMSNSMTPQYQRVVEAARQFIARLSPGDRLSIGTLGREVAISPWLTGNKDLLDRVLAEEVWPSGGGTPLWRASFAGMEALAQESGRRVIVTVTDGTDSGHEYNCTPLDTVPMTPAGPCITRADVARRATDEEFMFYAVGVERGLDPDLMRIVDETGGGSVRLTTRDDLSAAFARIAEELHHQYVLGFTPAALDGRTHHLEIRARQPGLTARARRSYVATGGR